MYRPDEDERNTTVALGTIRIRAPHVHLTKMNKVENYRELRNVRQARRADRQADGPKFDRIPQVEVSDLLVGALRCGEQLDARR
jgi:hypothetical protein